MIAVPAVPAVPTVLSVLSVLLVSAVVGMGTGGSSGHAASHRFAIKRLVSQWLGFRTGIRHSAVRVPIPVVSCR